MKDTDTSRFLFWRKYLMVLSVLMVLQGVSWVFIGSFEPTGWYDSWMAKSLFGKDTLPVDAQKAFAFVLVPFGATDAGFFVLLFFLVRYPFLKKEMWSYKAIVCGLLTWFVLDTGMCLVHGFYFNVLIVNVPAFVFLAPPLLLTRGAFVDSST